MKHPNVAFEFEIIDGGMYTVIGAKALEHVRSGLTPAELVAVMGGDPVWASMHRVYARDLARMAARRRTSGVPRIRQS
jgi:hypothetical protein